MPLSKTLKKVSSKKSNKKSKKTSKKSTKKSTKVLKDVTNIPKKKLTFADLEKKWELERSQKIKDEEDKKKEAIEAEKQEKLYVKKMEKIITPYIKDLEKKIIDKKQNIFFIWADKEYKPIYKTRKEIEETMSKNPEKYIGRSILQINIQFLYTKRNTIIAHGLVNSDTWMRVFIQYYEFEKYIKFSNSYRNGCNMSWLTHDFEITKYSLDFVKFVAKQIAGMKLNCGSIDGVQIKNLLEKFKKKNIKVPKDILKPLIKN
ncbi:MAG: hypothetical protein ACRCZI_13060 [Cetobacterium sp.]